MKRFLKCDGGRLREMPKRFWRKDEMGSRFHKGFVYFKIIPHMAGFWILHHRFSRPDHQEKRSNHRKNSVCIQHIAFLKAMKPIKNRFILSILLFFTTSTDPHLIWCQINVKSLLKQIFFIFRRKKEELGTYHKQKRKNLQGQRSSFQ